MEPVSGWLAQLKSNPLGRHEIEQTETFSLLAELALGLAGFTGVAGAFGGRDRAYSDADRVRLQSIFLAAGSVLVGSLCALTLTAAGWSPGQSYRWGSLPAAAVLMPFFYRVMPQAYALARDPDASTSIRVFAFASAQNLVSVCLLAGNFIAWREAWPLVGAFSIQLTWGLFLFARILTQRN